MCTNSIIHLPAPVTPGHVVSPSTVPPPVYSANQYPLQSNMMVHTPPPSTAYPPPYQHTEYQPPVNPNYKA